jgi:uncharacterized protein GlcG (DUF336 family)
VTASDALLVINDLALEGEMFNAVPAPIDFNLFPKAPGVDADGVITPGEFGAVFNPAESVPGNVNLLTTTEVDTLLKRASQATSSTDAIIAVVDRTGRILGVRVEQSVINAFVGRDKELAFAIDGAVAKARTAAFFASNEAPLTSRTIRNISQSTMTQREVQSSPTNTNPAYQGPGFVAPIGVGGHFPPQVAFTPQVDLFAIEHQSRDSRLHAGEDGIKGSGDDFALQTRFNADPAYIPENAEDFFKTWPESYGVQTERFLDAQSRGIGTLPGGVPLYKAVTGRPVTRVSESINLVGGIGVFFPGEDGFATHEQGFVHGIGQLEATRTNASRVLEAEFAAIVAAAGGGNMVGPSAFVRDLSEFDDQLHPLPNFVLPTGRIDLVGITLEVFGPNPTRQFPVPGIDRLIDVGRSVGRGTVSGELARVGRVGLGDVGLFDGTKLLAGQAVPQEWLVVPHASSQPGGLTAAQVEQIITQGIAEAAATRAAIRLNIDGGFRPGARTAMVLSVADTNGELLGVFRMPDATIFSIDVSIAKARNTAYYADPNDFNDLDLIDLNGDGAIGGVVTTLSDRSGDTAPKGAALTNRTFRFLAEPRYPTGIELPAGAGNGLVNDPNLDLFSQKPNIVPQIGPFSILRLPGINPVTGENIVDAQPLSADVYKRADLASVLSFDSFNVSRNFRDPGDDEVKIAGTNVMEKLANQNGIVFFPGSTALYLNNNSQALVGGFGVSGDGVDQDDVVTVAGQLGFAAPNSVRSDAFIVGGVRLPYQKFNRNPKGP